MGSEPLVPKPRAHGPMALVFQANGPGPLGLGPLVFEAIGPWALGRSHFKPRAHGPRVPHISSHGHGPWGPPISTQVPVGLTAGPNGPGPNGPGPNVPSVGAGPNWARA